MHVPKVACSTVTVQTVYSSTLSWRHCGKTPSFILCGIVFVDKQQVLLVKLGVSFLCMSIGFVNGHKKSMLEPAWACLGLPGPPRP